MLRRLQMRSRWERQVEVQLGGERKLPVQHEASRADRDSCPFRVCPFGHVSLYTTTTTCCQFPVFLQSSTWECIKRCSSSAEPLVGGIFARPYHSCAVLTGLHLGNPFSSIFRDPKGSFHLKTLFSDIRPRRT